MTYHYGWNTIYRLVPCRTCGGQQLLKDACRTCRGMGVDGVIVSCQNSRCSTGVRVGIGPDPNCANCHGTGISGEHGPWQSLDWQAPPRWTGDPDRPYFGPPSSDPLVLASAESVRQITRLDADRAQAMAQRVRVVSNALDFEYTRAQKVRLISTFDPVTPTKRDVILVSDPMAEPIRVVAFPM